MCSFWLVEASSKLNNMYLTFPVNTTSHGVRLKTIHMERWTVRGSSGWPESLASSKRHLLVLSFRPPRDTLIHG
jgi:hypothetical protein